VSRNVNVTVENDGLGSWMPLLVLFAGVLGAMALAGALAGIVMGIVAIVGMVIGSAAITAITAIVSFTIVSLKTPPRQQNIIVVSKDDLPLLTSWVQAGRALPPPTHTVVPYDSLRSR